jgi:glyoxylase-like metal-dependent hydrolase (beta-lactamase superfamily II)
MHPTTRFPIVALLLSSAVQAAGTSEFCLDGEFDLGARYQGTDPGTVEFVRTRWCVISDDDSNRVIFTGNGKSNPDMEGGWRVALVPGLVRIINADNPPDIEFRGADTSEEALRVRRMDPRRLVTEHDHSPIPDLRIQRENDRLKSVMTTADLPLRGRVPVTWNWEWSSNDAPTVTVELDGEIVFRARGSWRQLDDAETVKIWQASPGADPVDVPGDRWPAAIDMQRVDLADGVHLIRGVRTGFQHLVVDTDEGLVVADAPAGWVELHQLPPADLVPGLGISGLSERFIDYLAEAFPGRPIRAVALTHVHDDHAGGARAFAAERAAVYAPAEYARFLESALNRATMPPDRLTEIDRQVEVIPVSHTITLDEASDSVKLVPIGAGPHASASLGVYAAERGFFFVSDLHVPNSEDDVPRSDRAVTECWFANWAVANLPPDTLVINSHSAPQTPVSRLSKYLESERCQGLGD